MSFWDIWDKCEEFEAKTAPYARKGLVVLGITVLSPLLVGGVILWLVAATVGYFTERVLKWMDS